jgi:hypothetical protein
VIVVTVSIVALLVFRVADEAAVVPTADVLPRPVRVLMPGQLCDNLQGTLQYHVNTLLSLPYDKRQSELDNVVRVRQTMREVGCG